MYYRCSYDKYIYSRLVEIIDNLLKEDELVASELDEILSRKYESINMYSIKLELSKLSDRIDSLDHTKKEEKIKAINDYNDLFERYNKYIDVQNYENEFIEELKELININKIEAITKRDIQNLLYMIHFFGDISKLDNYVVNNSDIFYTEKAKEKKLERK